MKLVYLTAIVALGGGCGSDGGGEVPLSELGARMGAAICPKMIECCTVEELETELLGATTLMECEAFYAGFLGQLLIPVLEDSVAAGRLRYDAGAMGECIDMMAALECSELRQGLRGGVASQCEDPFTGLVADAGACANDSDCISGYCNGDRLDFEGNITFGACAVLPGQGQPCLDGDCAAGLRCDSSGTDICQPTLADGTACSVNDDCTSGECVGADTGNGTCGLAMVCDGQ